MHNILLWALALCQLLSPALALSRLWVVPTAGGYTGAFKGWSSFPLQSFRTPGFPYGDRFLTEDNLRAQAQAQAQRLLVSGYNYFMIDSGWSLGDSGDENGRIASNHTIFPSFPGFIAELHNMGLKVGVYIVPGVFASDYNAKKPIADSSFKINDVAPSPPVVNNQGRVKIAFDTPGRTSDAGRAWVKSNVKKFADWGVDLIKIDFLLPHTSGEVGNGDSGTHFGEVKAYRDAISASSRPRMWLQESYALAIGEPDLPHWRDTGDSYRISVDINNYPSPSSTYPSTMVSWFAVQRTVEAMRIYISVQLTISRPLKGFPDLDAMMIANTGALNMLSAVQRRTYFSFWIVTGVPIYLGDDLTRLDAGNLGLLTDSEVIAIHRDWTSGQSPAVYVNPKDGSRNPSQLQIWAAGPFGSKDEVIVLLINMGCAEDPNVNIGYKECLRGNQDVVATFDKLQISGRHCNRDVWAHRDTGAADTQISRVMGEGESVLFKLTPKAKGGNC